VVTGRKDLVKNLEEQLARNKGARMRPALASARFIKPDVLLYDGTWELTTGEGTARGLFTVVAVRREGKWLAVSRQGLIPYSPPEKGKKR
jgi:hypothetical protein